MTKALRICLINPRRMGLVQPAYSVRYMSTIPLSLPLLKALTPEPHRVDLVDENFSEIDYDRPYDLVGVTITTNVSTRAFEISRRFRDRGVPVVFGGFFPTLMTERARPHCDAIVAGEAEYVWRDLVADAADGRLKSLYKADRFIDMAHVPFIPKTCFPKTCFPGDREVLLVETTRGCPYRCDYCSVTAFYGHKFRMRSVEEVVRQVEAYRDRLIFFVDDNIAGVPAYAKELFRALEPLGLAWSGQFSLNRADDPELLRLAARSGCKCLLAGMESVNAESLGEVDKQWARPERYAEWIRNMQDAGIATYGAFMFGFDHDGPEVFQKTLDFCEENHVELALFSALFPIEGSKLYKKLQDEGRIFETDPERFNGQFATFHPGRMTAQELEEGLDFVWRAFYSKKSIKRRLDHLLEEEGEGMPSSLADISVRRFMVNLNMLFRAAIRRWPAPSARREST